jgi:cyanophycin synthetase
MDIRKVLALRGPNIWASFPVLEAWVDLGPLSDVAPGSLPGFEERLREWLPEPSAHPESVQEGMSLAHILQQLVLRLQCLAGSVVHFGDTRPTTEPGVYQVACAYEHEELARSAVDVAHQLCLATLRGERLDTPAEVTKLRDQARQLRLNPLAAAVTTAARRRNIPERLMGPGIVVLGHGARQQRILGTRTDRTGALAEAISRDTDLTRTLLHAAGVPVAEPDATERYRLLVAGRQVIAARDSGSQADVTPLVHPDVAERAVDAAEAVGLEVAGVMIAAQDISQPLQGQGGVVAVEANPSIEVEAAESLGEALVAGLFAEGDEGRVPIVAVTGVNGKTTTTRLIAHILTQARRTVGMTCTEGIYVAGDLIEAGDCSGPISAKTVLHHPEVEAVVVETARGGILRAGLGYDRCDVAVVTNVGEGDHLGCGGIETLEQLARVKRVIVEAVRPGGTAVLKADDPHVAAMARHTPGSVTFFARSPDDPVIVAHRAAGGRAVFVRQGYIVLARGEREKPVASLLQVPLTGGGRIGFQVENALAAVAAAWSLRIPHRTIRTALRSFSPGVEHAPARFNLLEVNGAIAVLDYGHNISSLAAILETLEQFPTGHRTAVYTAAGDRLDSDMIRQGEMLGDAFDRVILYEDGNCTRGRQPGEIMGLFRVGLANRSRVGKILEVQGAVRAVDQALASAQPGDLLLIQVDVVDETLDLVSGLLERAAVRQITLEEGLARLSGSRYEQASRWTPATIVPKPRKVKRTGSPRGGRRKVRRGS